MYEMPPDKFDWIEFEQPISWPEGRSPWMGVVTAQGRKPGVTQASSVFDRRKDAGSQQKACWDDGFVGSTRIKSCPGRSTYQAAMYSVNHSFEIIIPDSSALPRE